MTISLKKALVLIISAVIIVCAFAGCSAKDEEPSTTAAPITTDTAVFKNSDAIDLIKSYTAEQLGLEGTIEDYNIMVDSSGEEIDGKYYVKVSAGKISEPAADGTVTIDTYGQYFISYDGSEILNYDEEKNSYTPFSEVHSIPHTENHESSHSHNE